MREVVPARRKRTWLERDQVEGEVALDMVASGAAVTVRVHGLRYAERIAPILAAQAQRAAVSFRLERHDGSGPSLVFGPRLEGQSRR